MANGYSLPTWLTPQRAPWEALVAGVQAGSAIAANRQRIRALNAEMQQQAFRDKILTAKQAAEDSDRAMLGPWMAAFQTSTGENVPDPPPISDASMLNRLQMMVLDKRQKYGASEFAKIVASYPDKSTPEAQSAIWGAAGKYGVDLSATGNMLNQATTAKRLAESAASLATYREARIDIGYATLEETTELKRIAEERLLARDQATIEKLNAETQAVESRISLREGELEERRRRTDFLIRQSEGKLPPAVKSDLDYAKLKYEERGYSKNKIENIKMYEAERERLLSPYRQAEPSPTPESRQGIRSGLEAAPAALAPELPATKKLYFNPETGQLQDTPYARR